MSQNLKIAIISYSYGVAISPTIKNICSYLSECGRQVDVFVAGLGVSNFRLPGVNIVDLEKQVLKKPFLWHLRGIDRKKQFAKALKPYINDYSIFFAVDFLNLDILHSLNADMYKTIFLSLEGVDYMMQYETTYVKKILTQCGLCIVQSPERSYDIINYLKHEIEFEYLPVSHRPMELKNKPIESGLKLIYSGYLAEWACLLELLDTYERSRSYEISSLLIQGHAFGTEDYLSKVRDRASHIHNVTLDNAYYSDDVYGDVVSRHDVGIAFYKNITGTGNFENLSRSSGKISYYLWNGLPVVTNVHSEETQQLPFFFLSVNDPKRFRDALENIKANREVCRTESYRFAQCNYNFDAHFEKLMSKLS